MMEYKLVNEDRSSLTTEKECVLETNNFKIEALFLEEDPEHYFWGFSKIKYVSFSKASTCMTLKDNQILEEECSDTF